MPGALRGQWDEGAGLVRGPDFEGCQAVRTGPRGHGLMWAGMRAPKRWSNKELNARRPNIPRITVIWWAPQGICREEQRHCGRHVRMVYLSQDTIQFFLLRP